MGACSSSALACLDPEMILANAWVVAAEGTVTKAVKLAFDAARLAADRGQLAQEVLALQTAVGSGDVAGRLAELATLVDGRAHRPPRRTPPHWPPTTPTHWPP